MNLLQPLLPPRHLESPRFHKVSAARFPQWGELVNPSGSSQEAKNRLAKSVSKGKSEVTQLHQEHDKNKVLINVFIMMWLKRDFHFNCSTHTQVDFKKNQIRNTIRHLVKATLNLAWFIFSAFLFSFATDKRVVYTEEKGVRAQHMHVLRDSELTFFWRRLTVPSEDG